MANKQTLKNTTDRRVAQMRNELGGSNNLAQTSKFDKKNDKGIPVLNLTEYENLRDNINPIENIFRGSSISGLRSDKDSDYARLQELTPIYNQAEANRTQRQLERIGQTDIGRGTSDGLVNDIRNQGQGNFLERYINTPYSAPNVLKNLYQDNFTDRNGTLTPEMRALGITEESLQNWNDRQNEQERQEVLSQWAKDNPFISSINAVPENAFQSIANTARQVKDYVTGKPLETRETNADIYRSAVNEDIDSKVGQLAYSGANSLADMLFATLLTAPLGGVGGGANAARNVSRAAAAIMGAEKGNQVMHSAIERGLTPNQIMAEGAGSAFSTFATEALPLERILGGSHILSSMLSEGLQEGAEDLVDTAIDELVTRVGGNADKSELHQNYNAYVEAGYDPDEAFKNMLVDYGKQVGVDVLLGGITGGLMGGGSNLMSGRNIITGRIPTVAEAQTEQTAEAEQTIPEVKPIQNTPEAEQTIPNVEQPSEAVKTPVEDARTIVDNFLGSLPTLSKEQATQGYRNILETLTAIGNENPEIRSDLGAIWTDFNNQIKSSSSQQTIPNEAQQIPKVKQAVNYDWSQNVYGEAPARNIDTDLYKQYAERYDTMLREYGITDNALALAEDINKAYDNIVSAETATQQQSAIERFNYLINLSNETLENRTNDFYINNRNEEQIVNEPVSRLKRSELRQYQRQMEGMNSKLSTFKNKKDANRLTKAYNAIANSEGDAQTKAIEKFNSLMNEINEKMAGETVGITARDNNKELYEDMKRVTDGYKVRVSKDAVKQLGLNTFTELNNATNTRSTNRIKFVEKGGTPIDAVYPEMYDQAHGTLPSPQNMAEGDLLKALYNYITEPKSASGEMAYEESWNDIPADAIYSIDSQIEDITDPVFDKIDDGVATAEDLADAFNKLNEISMTAHNKDISQKCVDAYLELSDLLKEKVMNADVYDPDIEDADYDELNDLADQALEGYNPEDIEEEITFEIPREHNSTAGVNTGRYQQSEAYTNTAENSGMVNDKIRELDEKYGHMMYENNTEAESLAEADRRINENGEEAETKEVFNKIGWTNVDADVAMILYRRAFDYANSLDEQGVDSTEAWGYCYDLLEKIKEEGSRAGQALQAYAKWSRSNTPEGLLAEATSIIEEAKRGDNIDYSKASAWEREVERETRRAAKKDVFRKQGEEKGRRREVNATDIGFMREFLKEAAKLNDLPVNSLEFKRVYDNLGKLINTQIPAHLTEQVRTLLMDNMLGNARTLITRNAGGNIGFNLIEQLLRRPLTAVIDAGLSKARNTRRTTGWSLEGYKDWGKGAKDAFKQEWYDFLHGTHSARSGEVTLANATSQNRRVFKNNKTQKARGLNYLLNKADNLVRYGLSLGDRWAYEASYNQTIAELERLYNEGKMDRTITKDGKTTTFKMPRKEFEQYAQEQARINGLEACYQDDSEMAQAFLAARRLVNKMSRGLIGTDILSQFTIPFAKTPANIIQRAIEYSPLGLAKNAVQTIREVTNTSIGFDQRRFSVDTSRNIIGSALFALGIGLAKSGAMTGGYSEDKDMRQAQKEAGMQEYALHHPFGLEADVDIGWLPVLGNDMVAAAAAYDAASKPELSLGQSIGQGLTAGLKTQFETSALQGLSRFIGGQGSFGNSNGDVVSNAKDTLMSGMTQFVPSLLRQYANATDPYQRQLSGPNPDDYYFNSVMSAIPGLREKLEPKIGRTGEDLEQNHSQTAAGQWFNNFINPANVTYGTEDPVRDEAMRLYESIGDNRAFEPTVTMSELKVDDHVPTAEEFTEYQRAAYGAMNEAAQELFDTEAYEDMTDEEKVNVLAQLYSSIKTVEKKNILDLDKDNLSGPEKAYDENGVDGLIEYLTVKNYLSQMGLQNNEKNRQVVLDALNEGGTEAVQQMINDSQELSESDVFRYNHATNYIPSLTPSEFSDLWTTINTDGNTSIKQSEVIDYLNQNPEDFDAETALQYWRAFDQKAGHDGEWTKIPVLNPDTGLWEAKKV